VALQAIWRAPRVDEVLALELEGVLTLWRRRLFCTVSKVKWSNPITGPVVAQRGVEV